MSSCVSCGEFLNVEQLTVFQVKFQSTFKHECQLLLHSSEDWSVFALRKCYQLKTFLSLSYLPVCSSILNPVLCVCNSEWCMVLLVILVSVLRGLWRRSLPTHALVQQPRTGQWRGHLHRAAHRRGPV